MITMTIVIEIAKKVAMKVAMKVEVVVEAGGGVAVEDAAMKLPNNVKSR